MQFDAARCAESLKVSDDGFGVSQIADKSWGTVMSTAASACAPASGMYHWDVHLDRCERGHVFIGVATKDATVGCVCVEFADSFPQLPFLVLERIWGVILMVGV